MPGPVPGPASEQQFGPQPAPKTRRARAFPPGLASQAMALSSAKRGGGVPPLDPPPP